LQASRSPVLNFKIQTPKFKENPTLKLQNSRPRRNIKTGINILSSARFPAR
jgi:hypothetical protein